MDGYHSLSNEVKNNLYTLACCIFRNRISNMSLVSVLRIAIALRQFLSYVESYFCSYIYSLWLCSQSDADTPPQELDINDLLPQETRDTHHEVP